MRSRMVKRQTLVPERSGLDFISRDGISYWITIVKVREIGAAACTTEFLVREHPKTFLSSSQLKWGL